MLLDECAAGGVEIALGSAIGEVDACRRRCSASPSAARAATAPALVIATGGPSIPKMGATGFAYDLARRFGLKIVEPRPALVPLTLGGEEALFRDLSGRRRRGRRARAARRAFREAALFTHRGLSGPAILQISSYWRHGEAIAHRLPARSPPPAGCSTPSATRPRSTAAQALGDAAARPARRRAGRAARAAGRSRRDCRPRARRRRAAASPTGASPRRHRRLRQGRSHRRRHHHRRAVVADDGGAKASPASTRSARRSTSPAGSAAIISNGPGRAAGRRGRICRARCRPKAGFSDFILPTSAMISSPYVPRANSSVPSPDSRNLRREKARHRASDFLNFAPQPRVLALPPRPLRWLFLDLNSYFASVEQQLQPGAARQAGDRRAGRQRHHRRDRRVGRGQALRHHAPARRSGKRSACAAT